MQQDLKDRFSVLSPSECFFSLVSLTYMPVMVLAVNIFIAKVHLNFKLSWDSYFTSP